jgi:RimJ/RimL family protein N-acetyltransferase
MRLAWWRSTITSAATRATTVSSRSCAGCRPTGFFADVDYESRLALVIESPEDPDTLIAVARYEPAGEPGAAEVAFVAQDAWQDRGLGTVLFSELLAAAELNGIRRFRAWVLADNRRMLDLIARLGEVSQRSIEQGVVELSFTARPARSSGS